MRLNLIGMHPEWSIQAMAALSSECGVSALVAKAVVDELRTSGQVDIPAGGTDARQLAHRLAPFGVRVVGPESGSGIVEWPDVTDDRITLSEFNSLVERHVPELLSAIRDEQAQTASADGVELRPELTDNTIVCDPLVFSVLPSFIRAATNPVNADALARFNAFLMGLEASQPGMVTRRLMPSWLLDDLEAVPASLTYLDPTLLEQNEVR